MNGFIYIFSVGLFLSLFIFICFMFLVTFLSFFRSKEYKPFKPKITVVIPAHNEERHISKCIESVLSSDYPKNKIEIIVVDDGSDDKTREISRRYKIKLISQPHKGKVEALNKAVEEAKNKFILTIDADSYIEKDFIKKMVAPFSDKNIGATTGIVKIDNIKRPITFFQAGEYNLHNMIRHSFSQVFGNSVWFLGALACYRKDILKRIKFKKESLTEDMFLSLEMRKQNYKTISIKDAYGYTTAPDSLRKLLHQRIRWWIGGLQSIFKNKDMFKLRYGLPIIFLFINQIYWSLYAIVSLPVILYQVLYWLPYNTETISQISIYLIRFFSLWGPIYVISLIPKDGISFFTFFGVMSGILTTIIITTGMLIFKDKSKFMEIIAIFFYFPYTIALNIIILISLIKMIFLKKRYFIK